MKWIDKKAANEPKTLRDYRNTTPNARYTGFVDTDKILKKALCDEQGSICCYCMRRISENTVSVEHYITQTRHQNSLLSESEHQNSELLYENMLASCNDKQRNCSGIRGNKPLTVNPLRQIIEAQIGYKNNGEVFAIEENSDIETDIKTLDLNDTKQTAWLVKNRAIVIDNARNRLKNDFSARNIQKEILHWQSRFDKKQKEFCQVAIYYLNRKMRKAV
jgi:hypothetical protein